MANIGDPVVCIFAGNLYASLDQFLISESFDIDEPKCKNIYAITLTGALVRLETLPNHIWRPLHVLQTLLLDTPELFALPQSKTKALFSKNVIYQGLMSQFLELSEIRQYEIYRLWESAFQPFYDLPNFHIHDLNQMKQLIMNLSLFVSK